MSTRQIRKLREQMRLASMKDKPEPEVVQEDFQPHYVGAAGPAYSGLVVSSDSTDGDTSTKEINVSSDSDDTKVVVTQKKRNKNNRKKRNKNKRRESGSNNSAQDDEDVERAVAEVNELLGEPEAPKPEPSKLPSSERLLKINHKYLSGNDELTRLFGRDEDEGPRKRPQHDNARHHRRQIVLTKERYSFSVKGLSMKCIGIVDGIRYFKFEHSVDYQRHLYGLVRTLKMHYENYIREQDWAYEVYQPNTVEALVTNLDLYFQLDEASIAAESLEQAIYFMQTIFHQSFSYLDGKCRLEYKHIENRVFHIILLKYLHILTNKACHRTALEIAKLLINLDPSDPLGVIFIVDTLALRAREHQWLSEIFIHWAAERGAGCLFHLRYSYALALYHLYLKNRNETTLFMAEKFITTAIMRYPNVVVMLMRFCKQEKPEFVNHEICTLADQTTSEDLKSLMALYAKFVWPKWREQNVMTWVTKNAIEVINGYDNDEVIKNLVLQKAKERTSLFKKHPLEIRRHLHIISAMSNLLVEGAVPPTEKTVSFNPYPSEGVSVDEYGYYRGWGVRQEEGDPQSVLRTFIQSLVPEGPIIHNMHIEE